MTTAGAGAESTQPTLVAGTVGPRAQSAFRIALALVTAITVALAALEITVLITNHAAVPGVLVLFPIVALIYLATPDGPALDSLQAAGERSPGTELVTQPGWETLDIDGAIRAVKRAKPLPRMPLAVVSKTEQFGLTPDFPKDIAARLLEVWPISQNRLVPLQPQTPHILATGSDRYVQLHDPDLVTSAIRLIVERVRGIDR